MISIVLSYIRYSAAEYAKSQGRDGEAGEYMRNGIKANKLSFLLHFQFAENEEDNHRVSEVRTTLESLINNISQEYEKMNKMAEFMKIQLDGEDEADTRLLSEIPEEERENVLNRLRKRKQQKEIIDREHEMRIDSISNDATNAWITLMHAIRRAEGIKSARQIFAKARKAKPLSHHIFVASGNIYCESSDVLAMMEFHNNDDKGIATKVFELGLKSYHDKSDYVLHYLDFLIQINDEPSISSLILS
jgi:cleavage stimulation factor subunit 3